MKHESLNVNLTVVFVIMKRQNDDKCRCEYKELIDKGVCDKGFI